MMSEKTFMLAACGVAMLAGAAGDPYDYKELVERRVEPVALVRNAKGHAVVDFGRDAFGWLEIAGGAGDYEIVIGEMTNAEGRVANPYPGSTIRVQTLKGTKPSGWHRPEMKPDRWNLTGYNPKVSPAIRLPERFGLVFPFRYAEVVRAPSEPDRTSFVQKAVNYPIDMSKSSFACSDADLVRVYEFCKYSVLATSFTGIYVDGDRERTPYEADAYINQMAHYAIDDDCSMARRSFEWLMDHPTWPTEWKQHMVMMAWADWMWTGDTRSIARFYDKLRDDKLLNRFVRPSDGLLETGGEMKKGAKPGAADIVDWPAAERDGFEFRPVNAVVNAFHYRNLLEMRDMAAALGKDGESAAFAARAANVRKAYDKAFFDAGRGLYLDGEGAKHASIQANAAALAFGLVPSDRVDAVADWLVSRGMACSTYFAQYLLEALFESGRDEAAIALLTAKGDRGWLGMMDFGSTITTEAWNMKAKPNQDLNHAWAASPLSMVTRYVLGVKPLQPGFRRILVAPRPGKLRSASGTVPTVAGPIRVSVKDGMLSVETPVPARVVWKGRTYEMPAGTRDFFGAAFVSPAGNPPEKTSAAVFEKREANSAAVTRAVWSVTAQGVFEAYVNGARVGDDFLKPGFTSSEKCRHVYTYDVTGLLKRGKGEENVLSATVAPGWWCDGMMTSARETPWRLGRKLAFRGELELEYADGGREVRGTDSSWRSAYAGPVVAAGIYEGETYDARRPVEGLSPSEINREFAGELRPAAAKVTLRRDLELKPRDLYVTKGAEGATSNAFGTAVVVRRYRDGDEVRLGSGELLVVDFGQNAAAVPAFEVSGAAGTTVTIRHAEMLNEANGAKARGNDGPAGTPYLASLRSANAALAYTLGEGANAFLPRHTFFGYRYLAVTATGPVTFASLRSVPVSSVAKEMERGSVTTGNARVNRLIENVRWGVLSNYLSIPTDCPQRDERMGWTADTQVFMDSAAYLLDTYDFLVKYLADLRDAQFSDGLYPCFVPNLRHVFPHWASCGWTDAGVIIPYRLWKWYGRREIVETSWPSMKRYMDFLESHETPYRINHGDWLAFEHTLKKADGTDKEAPDPRQVYLLNDLFPVWMSRLMREMAEATGRTDEARHFGEREAALRRIFTERYVGADGCLKDEYKGQCNDLYMIKLGLCGNAAALEATKQDLVANIRAHGNRLQTGFLGTAILMPTLTFEANAPDVAYDLLLQDRFPSWLYSVDQGATTVWERWNGYTKATGFGPVIMNSFNHYAYGCVLEWIFSAAAGIRPDPKGGWGHFILRPYPDRRLGSLKASYRSPAGLIRSEWACGEDGAFRWTFEIPEGATATVTTPDGRTEELSAGTHERILQL